MTPEDFEQLRAVAPFLEGLQGVAVLSPLHGSVLSRVRESELRLLPKATAVSRRQWDLDEQGTRDFEVVIAANVFMYSKRPCRWFENALARCAFLLLLDLVRRRRSADAEFGDDGDCMRYAIGRERPRVSDSFDLASLGDRILGWRTFWGGANEYDDVPLHLLALVRGSLWPANPATAAAAGQVVAALNRPAFGLGRDAS